MCARPLRPVAVCVKLAEQYQREQQWFILISYIFILTGNGFLRALTPLSDSDGAEVIRLDLTPLVSGTRCASSQAGI
jgi:hypothetical protein